MSSDFIGFRLSRKKDEDILEVLDNAKNKTKEIKRLLRIAIQTKYTTAPPAPVRKHPKKKKESHNIEDNILCGFD